MNIYKDCEEYYLYGDNLPDLACVLAEMDGIETEDAAVVTLRFPGSSKKREVSEMVSEWMLEVAKQEVLDGKEQEEKGRREEAGDSIL